MTVYEQKLWFEFLQGYEVSFRKQKVIGSYIVDFYCRKARLSIEIDGESHFTQAAETYDMYRTRFLELREIKELRFTNADVRDNFEGVCEVIHEEVVKRRNDLNGSNFSSLRNRT